MIRSLVFLRNKIFKFSRQKCFYKESPAIGTYRLLSSSKKENSHDGDKKKGSWRNNGTPELLFGFTLLTLLGVDHFLQREQEKNRLELKNQMRALVREDQKNDYESNQKDVDGHQTASALFQCKIMRVPPEYFDGYKCLSSNLIKIGDIVDVLEEQVGPDKMYHLCRTTTTADCDQKNEPSGKNESLLHVGWFPTSCLEKLL